MPEDPKPLVLRIEVDKKTGELKVLGVELEDLKNKSKTSAAGIGSLDAGLGGMMKTLAGLASVDTAIRFFQESIQEALSYQDALGRVSYSLRAVDADFNNSSEKIAEWADQIEEATRFTDDQFLDTFNKLVRTTRDAEAAFVATKVAMGASVTTHADLARTTEIVNGLLLGNARAVLEARKEFGSFIQVGDSAQEALSKIQRKFEDTATSEKSATKELGDYKDKWNDLKKDVGNVALPGLTLALDVTHKLFLQMVALAKLPSFIAQNAAQATSFKTFFAGIVEDIDEVLGKVKQSDDIRKKLNSERGTQELQDDKKISDLKLQNLDRELQQNLASRLLTQNQKLADLQQFEDRELAILDEQIAKKIVKEEEAEQRRLGIFLKYDQERTKIRQEAQFSVEVELERWLISNQNVQKQITQAGLNAANNVSAGFGKAFADSITEGKSFSDSMQKVFKSMVNAIIAELARIAAVQFLSVGVSGAFGIPRGLPGIGGGIFGGADGANQTVDRPTLFVAGEGNRRERVQITPARGGPVSPDNGVAGEKVTLQFGDININVTGLNVYDPVAQEVLLSQLAKRIRTELGSSPQFALILKDIAEKYKGRSA